MVGATYVRFGDSGTGTLNVVERGALTATGVVVNNGYGGQLSGGNGTITNNGTMRVVAGVRSPCLRPKWGWRAHRSRSIWPASGASWSAIAPAAASSV
jgi:hypothetical protein